MMQHPLRHLLWLVLVGALGPACGSGGSKGGGGSQPLAEGVVGPLGFAVVDAEYSRSLDRLVMVSASPHRLHSVDPSTGADQQVTLPRAPGCVSVSPDGLTAAVGFDGLVCLVDLSTVTVTAIYPVTCDVLDIVLASNGYLYAFPRHDQWEQIRCIATATGAETPSTGNSIYAGTLAKLRPGSTSIYGATNGLSPASLEIYSIAPGTAAWSTSTSSQPTGGNLWIGSDGQEIVTQPGTVFSPSLGYLGTLSGISAVVAADMAPTAGKILVVPGAGYPATPANQDAEVQIFDSTTLALLGRFALPDFTGGLRPSPSLGRWVFVRAGETKASVVVQAFSREGMASAWGIVSVPLAGTGVALGAPGDFRGHASISTAILQWAPVPGATGYSVYGATVPGVTPGNYSGLSGGLKQSTAATQLSIGSITPGTAYSFVVTATSATGESAPSIEISVTPTASTLVPGAVAGLVATPGDGQIGLSWSATPGATSYTVYEASASGVSPLQGEQLRTTFSPSLVWTGLTNGQDVYFCATASNGAGEGPASVQVTAAPRAPAPPISTLTHKVVDAEYSRALDRIVMVAGSPNSLFVLDPVGGGEASVALPAVPECVSIAPSGMLAAVGYNGSVSLVDLTGPTVSGTWTVTCNAAHVVLGANGFIYAFGTGSWDGIHCLNTGTGVETLGASSSVYGNSSARLQPGATALYSGDTGLSPSQILKFDTAGGTATFDWYTPYFGDFAMGGNLWYTENGSRILSSAGTMFSTSSIQAQDMRYRGSFPGVPQLQSCSHSAAAGRAVVIPAPTTSATADTEIRFFEDQYFDLQSRLFFPTFVVVSTAYPAHGKFVFWNSAGSQVFVIVQADPAAGLTQDFGRVTFVP
ncbi:MAG TPA: fibronectin type III domain-containing protein [Planctomycetota bacterium]|nr:fibronectin type III domain-containing protein [Planctomycetota bacterium]